MYTWELSDCLSPYNNYCCGFGSPGASGNNYLSAIILTTGKTKLTSFTNGYYLLDKIIAYDKAEVTDTFLGQINMIKVSSFCGPQGRIWGYDMMYDEPLKEPHPLCPPSVQDVPVYNSWPIQESARSLFGTIEHKNFPILPGSHVPCAFKKHEEKGPCILFCGSAVAIPYNRNHEACLFMEEIITVQGKGERTIQDYKRKILSNLAWSVIRISENQRLKYREIFLDVKSIIVDEGEIGCAMVANPYFLIARNAVSPVILENFSDITLKEWQQLIY